MRQKERWECFNLGMGEAEGIRICELGHDVSEECFGEAESVCEDCDLRVCFSDGTFPNSEDTGTEAIKHD